VAIARFSTAIAKAASLKAGTSKMTAPLRIELSETTPLRAHYEVAMHDNLRLLWRRKLLIALLMAFAVVLASIAVVLIGPRYTSEAVIQLNFSREESLADAKIQPIVSMDPVAVVDSAASIIRSRTTASAVVARLGLDKDPDFAHESALWHILSDLRNALGLVGAKPSPRDLAVNSLMREVTVTNEPHSYLISIAITGRDPERAATLANAVALEYLRGEAKKQMADKQAGLERELGQLASVYGVSHPDYVLKRAALEDLEARMDALRGGSLAADASEFVIGQSFIAAEKVTAPSGPNILLILGLTVGATFVVGIWLALLLRPAGRSEAAARRSPNV
jgi:uncharacterized protein involved in exopolysaccharide biosynthesis